MTYTFKVKQASNTTVKNELETSSNARATDVRRRTRITINDTCYFSFSFALPPLSVPTCIHRARAPSTSPFENVSRRFVSRMPTRKATLARLRISGEALSQQAKHRICLVQVEITGTCTLLRERNSSSSSSSSSSQLCFQVTQHRIQGFTRRVVF